MNQSAGWLGTVLGLMLLAGGAQAGGAGEPPPAVPGASAGCVPGYVRPDFAALERELNAARARWRAAGVRDYRYDFRQVAAPVLFPTVRVTVRGGAVRDVVLVAGQTGEPSAQARATVEERFVQIAQALAFQRAQPCPAVEVTYDREDGHPTRLSTAPRDLNVADGDGEWTLTNFTRP
ncbi:DUF6174 domain-containing protein [Deinococcus budaensis]|uniref:Lipoprotein n=1 Tax=Deinococcus budaensis TaxID=1665626 RepID=A0A7W8GG84_9DEIO|nr:DUF6174 domain-containing protein [Deinococcus budaensis]MBB5235112.1 hypothetical protein [Deinococcus budaensis]